MNNNDTLMKGCESLYMYINDFCVGHQLHIEMLGLNSNYIEFTLQIYTAIKFDNGFAAFFDYIL